MPAHLATKVDGNIPLSDLPVVRAADCDALAIESDRLEAGMTGASRGEIERTIGMLAVLFPAGKQSDQEAAMRLELYVELLSDIPADILSRAATKVGKTSRFFPAVSEIREAAAFDMNLRSWRLMRMRSMIARFERERPSPDDGRADPAVAEMIKAAARNFKA